MPTFSSTPSEKKNQIFNSLPSSAVLKENIYSPYDIELNNKNQIIGLKIAVASGSNQPTEYRIENNGNQYKLYITVDYVKTPPNFVDIYTFSNLSIPTNENKITLTPISYAKETLLSDINKTLIEESEGPDVVPDPGPGGEDQ